MSVNIDNKDIIIDHDFNANGGRIEFPFESFDIKETNKGYAMLRNISKQFDIFYVEIYKVWRLLVVNIIII